MPGLVVIARVAAATPNSDGDRVPGVAGLLRPLRTDLLDNRFRIVHKRQRQRQRQRQRSIRPARRFGGTGIRPILDVAVAEVAVAVASPEH